MVLRIGEHGTTQIEDWIPLRLMCQRKAYDFQLSLVLSFLMD